MCARLGQGCPVHGTVRILMIIPSHLEADEAFVEVLPDRLIGISVAIVDLDADSCANMSSGSHDVFLQLF